MCMKRALRKNMKQIENKIKLKGQEGTKAKTEGNRVDPSEGALGGAAGSRDSVTRAQRILAHYWAYPLQSVLRS
jgi:hypothetical protein